MCIGCYDVKTVVKIHGFQDSAENVGDSENFVISEIDLKIFFN